MMCSADFVLENKQGALMRKPAGGAKRPHPRQGSRLDGATIAILQRWRLSAGFRAPSAAFKQTNSINITKFYKL